jgi:hypothetical protein
MDFGDNLVLKTNWTPTYVQSAQHPLDLFSVILDSSDSGAENKDKDINGDDDKQND